MGERLPKGSVVLHEWMCVAEDGGEHIAEKAKVAFKFKE